MWSMTSCAPAFRDTRSVLTSINRWYESSFLETLTRPWPQTGWCWASFLSLPTRNQTGPWCVESKALLRKLICNPELKGLWCVLKCKSPPSEGPWPDPMKINEDSCRNPLHITQVKGCNPLPRSHWWTFSTTRGCGKRFWCFSLMRETAVWSHKHF